MALKKPHRQQSLLPVKFQYQVDQEYLAMDKVIKRSNREKSEYTFDFIGVDVAVVIIYA